MNAHSNTAPRAVISVDVEEWFHILDSPAVPKLAAWGSLESRVQRGMGAVLEILADTNARATFFWLGWLAERQKPLLAQCIAAGHEIASHGYAHVLAYEVGQKGFGNDVERSKKTLEDLVGRPVRGFRAAGFGIREENMWAFDEIRKAGYDYDSSVFPASRGHGGMRQSPPYPHIMQTTEGSLIEIPQSTIECFGKRFSMFGGGYLRFFPYHVIRWGARRLRKSGLPLVIYIHPRELDPEHPRLPLGMARRFKSYFNLKSSAPKLRRLCQDFSFQTMGELADQITLNARQ